MARTYKRDNRGRFASTGSTSGGSKGGSSKPKTRVVIGARNVSGGKNRITRDNAGRITSVGGNGATGRGGRLKTPSGKKRETVLVGMKLKRSGVIAKPKGLKPGELKARSKTSQPTSGGRKRNLKAEAAKAAANRTGVVSGKKFTHGQDVKTMSLAELRTAVRQHSRKGGAMNRKDFVYRYALPAGVVTRGKDGLEAGRMPKTRGDWEKIYRNVIGVPQAERNRKNRPGVINGIDIHKNFRPAAVFGLNPSTAKADDVNRAYRRLAKQVHPDMGGRQKDFERLTKMRDSMLALMGSSSKGKGSSSKGKDKGKKGAAAPAAAAPSGPRMLPPAGSTSASLTAKPKARRAKRKAS